MESPETRDIGSHLFEAEPRVVEDEGIAPRILPSGSTMVMACGIGVDCSPEAFVCGGKLASPLLQVGLRVPELSVEMRVL